MPRKKRGRKRVSEDDDIEVPRKRRHVADEEEAVVISDSDHEEQVKPTARETRLRARRNKAQTQGLTTTEEEEEMLSLAMKLSAEEMTNSEIRQKQEDEDMTRAIEESLNANRTQISNDNSETVLLTMTPTQGSTALLSQDPPLAPESPVFPAGEKPSCQSGSRTDPDCSSYNDAVIDMDEMKDCPQTYMPDVNESRTDTSSHLPALETSKDGEVQPSNQQSQGPSTGHLPRGRDAGDSRREGSSQGLVLCIERLSQELVAGCQTSGFVQCSQEFPVHLSPSGKLVSSLQSSTMLPQSPGFSGTDSGSLDRGAQSSARCSIPTTHSGDEGESQDFPLQEESSDTSQSLSPCKRRLALRLKRATGGGGPCGQGNHSQERSEEELPKRKSRTDPVEEGSILTASKEKDDLTSQMDLHWSEKEDEDLGTRNHRLHDSDIPGLQSTQGTDCGLGCHVPPLTSPVFPREQRPPRLCTLNPSSPSMGRPQHLTTEVSRGAGTPQRDQTRESSRVRRRFSFGKSHPSLSQGLTKSSVCQGPSEEGPELGAVHYYWGIPFCPRGQNPDQYTEVILSQLEVYEKSLKEARKTLLRKAEWGSPMIPGSLPQRARPTRPRALRPLDDGDTEAADEEEEQGDREKATVVEEEGEAKEEKNADSPVGSEGGQKDGEKSLAIWLQKRPMLCVSEELPEKQKFLRRRGRRVSSLAEGGTPQSQGQEDEETQLCSETQLSEAPLAELSRESPADTEVMVLDQEVSTPPGGGRAQQEEGTESEVEPDARAHGEWVQCPICMHRFPPTRIEIHAAYCDGLAEDPVAEEPRSRSRPFDRAHSAASGRRKWSRDAAGIDDTQPTTSANGRAQSKEKCYLCQGTFRLKDYEKHVEDCIRQSSARRDAKNLLMALDQSERNAPSSTAGPSNSTRIKGHSSVNPRDDDSLDTAALVSSSPIKSFTRISEATDCSVDFKRQHSDNPGQRGQRKRFK